MGRRNNATPPKPGEPGILRVPVAHFATAIGNDIGELAEVNGDTEKVADIEPKSEGKLDPGAGGGSLVGAAI